MNPHSIAAVKIIKAQLAIIGPIALDQAKNVSGLKIIDLEKIEITGNGKAILTNLVIEYSKFFGRASIEVCKDALKEIRPPIPQEELPEILIK